jgi:thiamine kinase-like enzyme
MTVVIDHLRSLAIDDDVAAALHATGLRARTCTTVTTITVPGHHRGTYRVELDAGTTIKARRLKDERTARLVADARKRLPSAFVRVLAHHGSVLLEEWVDGDAIGPDPDAATVSAAAELLAAVHDAPANGVHVMYSPAAVDWQPQTRHELEALSRSGELSASDASTLLRMVNDVDRSANAPTLCHFDFCGENMVRTPANELRVIDNERVGTGARDFDLARTWYRWKLTDARWTTFANSYRACSRAPDAFATFDFWRVVVLVQSLNLRRSISDDLARDVVLELRKLASAVASAA